MRVPVVVVTGVDPLAMDSVLMSLAWGSPNAVSMRHRIDPESQVLTRTVSDVTGVLETEHIQLEHACVSCALREDIVPTLERLAADGRWSSVVAGLPTGTEAGQLSHILGTDHRLARRLKLSSVVAALSAATATTDLLGDDLLRERGVHTNPDDDRGVGEVSCAQVELADVVVLDADAGPEAEALAVALARPDARLVTGADRLDATELTTRRHQRTLARTWCSPELGADLPALAAGPVWRLDLRSSRAFHPDRLLDQIERLGTGAFRSRGSFWLPTRPGKLLEWAGSGGQVSIGSYRPWGRETPLTRLILTGLGQEPAGLDQAFEEILLTPAEAQLGQRHWDVLEDGLEPWLGEIRDAA